MRMSIVCAFSPLATHGDRLHPDQNPTGRLYSEALGRMLSVGRKLKMEIPV